MTQMFIGYGMALLYVGFTQLIGISISVPSMIAAGLILTAWGMVS